MTAFFLMLWQGVAGAADATVRAVKGSRTLQYIAGGLAAALIVFFGVNRAVKRARREGAEEGREKILDRIERDSKHAIEKIEEAGRDLSEEIGPTPVFEDSGDGRGLTTDDLNNRELERLRKRTESDPRNRRNPREDPRG